MKSSPAARSQRNSVSSLKCGVFAVSKILSRRYSSPSHSLHYMPTFNTLAIIMIFLSSQLDSSFSRAEMMFVDCYMLRVYDNYSSIACTVDMNRKSDFTVPMLEETFSKSNMLCLQQLTVIQIRFHVIFSILVHLYNLLTRKGYGMI